MLFDVTLRHMLKNMRDNGPNRTYNLSNASPCNSLPTKLYLFLFVNDNISKIMFHVWMSERNSLPEDIYSYWVGNVALTHLV